MKSIIDKINDESDILVNGLILLSILDEMYWSLFYEYPNDVPPPHVYFPMFVQPHSQVTNYYEKYLSSRNEEAKRILPKSSELCFALEGTPAGTYEGTMRGSDPCLPKQSIVKYIDSVRDNAARYYAFAVPTLQAAEAIKA